MKVRIMRPEMVTANEDEFLGNLNFQYVYPLFGTIAEWYGEYIPLWRVLNHYGIWDVGDDTDEEQIQCLLIDHGSEDTHASARYFLHDRETDERREAVYCYKCQRLLTSFWYIYNMEKDRHGLTSVEIFHFIWEKFGVAFPRDLYLDFDPSAHYDYDMEQSEEKGKYFARAQEVLMLKESNPQIYLDSLIYLYVSSGKVESC
jgi:hypothetical protein